MTDRLTDEMLEEIRESAEAATDTAPGCWVTDDGRQGRSELPSHVPYLPFVARVSAKGFHPVAAKLADDGRPEGCEFRETIETARIRARHIATADPPTVLALVDEVERLREEIDDYGDRLGILLSSEGTLAHKLEQAEAKRDRYRKTLKRIAYGDAKDDGEWATMFAAEAMETDQ